MRLFSQEWLEFLYVLSPLFNVTLIIHLGISQAVACWPLHLSWEQGLSVDAEETEQFIRAAEYANQLGSFPTATRVLAMTMGKS